MKQILADIIPAALKTESLLSLDRPNVTLNSTFVPFIASMKHVAFVFDALIYYMRSGNDLDLKNAPGIVEQQQVNFFDHEQDFIDNKDDDRTKI